MSRAILFFCAPWCASCGRLEAAMTAAGVVFRKINVDDNPEIANKYGILGLPTVVVTDDAGGLAERHTTMTAEMIRRLKP